jgi:hypothetical protein
MPMKKAKNIKVDKKPKRKEKLNKHVDPGILMNLDAFERHLKGWK